MRQKEKGITMIALVITIIVLIILAGISIAGISGENGIIKQGENAKRDTEIARYKSELEEIKHEKYAKKYTIEVDEFLSEYADIVLKKVDGIVEATPNKINKLVEVLTKEGYKFEVSIEETIYVGTDEDKNTGDISKVKIEIRITPENWTRDKVKVKIISNIANIIKEYSIDGGNSWNKYKNEIEVQDNGIEIQARGINEKNEKTEVVRKKIENIDRLVPNTFVPTVQGTLNKLEITASTTDKEATTKDGKSEIKGYKFSKDNGSTWTGIITEGRYTYENLQPGTTYPIKVKAIDKAGNEVETNTINGTTEEEIIVPDGEGRISFVKEPNGWTRGQVRVQISTGEQGYGIEYSLDGSEYISYSSPVEVSENRTIYARLTKNGKIGKSATYNVDNIDRLQPKDFAVNIQGKTTNSIVVEGNTTDEERTGTDGSSGIRGYRFSKDNGYSWTGEQVSGTYTFSGLTSGTSYQVKVKAIDNAGNERETTAINETTNQLPNPAEKIQITKTPSSWTNGIVTVRITNMAQEYILQYSKDNRSWETYLSPITVVDNNETIYARLYEPNSQEATRSISTQITNIDRLSPIIFTPTVNAGIDTIAVTANTVDREATTIDGKSGIRGYKFSKDSGYSWTEEQASETYTFGRLSPGTSYQIRVKAIDNAGNEMEGYEVTGTTIQIPGGNNNIYFNYSPSGWTNRNVTVTITASTTNYRLQYSKDGYTWYDYDSYQKVTMTENGPVYARLTDGVNYGTIATGNISNIDKIAPNVSYSTNPSTGAASEVTIYINATDSLSGISSITNTTYDNIRKIDDRTYIVTANGTYYFTVTDRAGNVLSKSVYINNVKPKELQIGDYVNYIPSSNNSYYISKQYSGYIEDKNIDQEKLIWRVYKINDDGTVILVSTQATTAAMGLGGALGYNNSVYLLDKTCQELYSNNSIGAIARNIKIEDIENELNQNALNKINSYVSTGGSRIGEKRTFYEYYAFYPNLYKHEKGAGIDTTITNSTGVEKSDKYYNTPTTKGMTRAQSLTITQTSYNVPLEINDFKNDVTLELLRGPKYWISSRAVDDSTNGYAIFATLTFFPNRILPYSNMDSTNTTIAQNFSLKPLVTLKKDKIKMCIGENNENNMHTIYN